MGEPKTVIVVSDSAMIDGGLGKVAVMSAIALARTGRKVIFFCPIAGEEPSLQNAGVDVVNLGQVPPSEDPSKLRGMMRGVWNADAAKALSALIKGLDPKTTIIHCHGYSKALSPAIGPVLTHGPIKSVYTMHEFFLACPNGGFFDFPRAKICTRAPLGISCLSTNCDSRHMVHKVWRVARQLALRGPGHMPSRLSDIICISKTARAVMSPYLDQKTTLHDVPNPIDLFDGPRVDAGSNDAFVFVGRLEPDKGAFHFAKAAKAAGVKTIFIGSGREETAIRSMLPDAVLTGWLSPDAVLEKLSAARCLVFPSLWQETFGLVAYEALARGVPVITGAWNAACEVVEHDKTGLIYDRPDDLAGALRAMTPAVADQMSRTTFANRDNLGLSPSAHASRLIEVYRKVMS